MALFLHLILCASTNAEKLSEFISLESGMTLYAPLDDNAEPLETSGKRPSDAGKVEFAPGVRGNAFLFRDAEGFIDYATKGVVSTDAGTISVWVKPLEWGKSDTHIRHFMTFTAGEQDRGYFCWLYKFFSSPAYFLVWEPDYGRPVLVRSKKGWEQGKWQHFVATWNGNRMGLVVNGEPSPATYTLRQSLLPSLAAKLRLGGRSDPDKRATLLDEFYVFNRELTAAEAKSLFDLDKAGMEESLPARTEVSLPRIESFKLLGLRARQYPGVSRVVAGLDVFRMNKKERQGFSAVLKLEVPGGEVVQEHALPLRRAYIEHAFDTSKLKPGEYLLSAELLNGKKSVERAKVGFTLDPKPEWLANTLGKSPDVIEPWTPVKVEQGTASCWGRRIVWDGRVLPGQIKSQGSDLLAAPMRIVATVAGKETLTTEESFAFVEENPQRTSFEGKARLGTMEVRVKGWMEFDGMIWMTVSVSGPDGARIDRLALEIPMRKKAATLMITNRGIAPGTGSLTPLQTRATGKASLWVGNEKVGLSWSCPEYRDWHCPAPDPRVEILPREDDVLFRTNWISRPAPMQDGRVFTFGLMPGPVRPKTKGWRKWGFGCQPTDSPINIFTAGWSKGFGFAEPGKKYENWYAKDLAKGKRLLWYLTQAAVSPVIPEFRAFGDEWSKSPFGNRKYDPKGGPKVHTNACNEPASLIDSLLWTFKKHLSDTEVPVTGVYVDVAATAHCSNGYHGCGYEDESGNRIATLPILGVREWQKRLYTFLRKQHPGSILMNHQSADINLYQLGFCDSMVDGENLTMLLQKKSYPELLPLDTWRAEYMGHQFGYVSLFLPEFTRAFAGDKKKKQEYQGDERLAEVEYIAGMCITHDTLIWPAYSNPSPYFAVREAKMTFGWGDEVEFLPYWDNRQFVALEDNPDPKRIVCTLYLRPGAVMASIMNTTAKEVTVKLKLNYQSLKMEQLQSDPWLDAYLLNTFEYQDYRHNHPRPMRTFKGRRVEIPQENGTATVTIRPHNFRLLLLRKPR